MKKTYCLLGFVTLPALILLVGCASPIAKKEIAPKALTAMHKHPGTVLVNANGGGKFSDWALVGYNVENAPLQEAIAESITSSGLFSQAVSVGNADYQLDVLLVLIKQPAAQGFTFKSGTRMLWTLTRLQDHKQVFQDEIVTEDRKTVGDYFVAVTRSRAAVTGAIRKNIQEGIERIGKTEF